jgi:hypothetical protein
LDLELDMRMPASWLAIFWLQAVDCAATTCRT